MSAWMLELIMILSAVLRKHSDLAVASGLLVVNSVLSLAQEHRAAGIVEELRRHLQVNARVRRDKTWQVIPARELVPGDIVRVRPGDIIPAIGLGLHNIRRMADLKAASAQNGDKVIDPFEGADGFTEVFPEDQYIVVKHLG
jgi:hypothetical protein